MSYPASRMQDAGWKSNLRKVDEVTLSERLRKTMFSDAPSEEPEDKT
jgi:hypothetical protein